MREKFQIIKLIIAISCLFLSCVSTIPSKKEIEMMDYGQVPTIDIEKAIRDNLFLSLNDPESAQIKDLKNIGKFWIRIDYKNYAGYAFSYYLNAKNKLGGYVGFKEYIAGFYNNNLMCNYDYEKFDSIPNSITHTKARYSE